MAASTPLFTREQPLVRNLLILDGFTRAGKFFLGKIVGGLKDADYFQSVSALEQIPFLHRLGAITENGAVALFRKILDEHAYNARIGRNLNTRTVDASSIFNSHEFGVFLRRAASPFGAINMDAQEIVDSFRQGRRWSVFVTHETLPNAGILFQAYPGLRMINLLRHPADLIHSWFVRGWGRRFGNDPLAFTPVIDGPGGPTPWQAYGYQAEYEKMNEAERVIRDVAALTEFSATAYGSLDAARKSQILFVRYENLVEKPHEEIARMNAFLGTEASEGMPAILAREKCPGTVSLEKRRSKAGELAAKSGPAMAALLRRLSDAYESMPNPYEAKP
jgi:hypothetical protein